MAEGGEGTVATKVSSLMVLGAVELRDCGEVC